MTGLSFTCPDGNSASGGFTHPEAIPPTFDSKRYGEDDLIRDCRLHDWKFWEAGRMVRAGKKPKPEAARNAPDQQQEAIRDLVWSREPKLPKGIVYCAIAVLEHAAHHEHRYGDTTHRPGQEAIAQSAAEMAGRSEAFDRSYVRKAHEWLESEEFSHRGPRTVKGLHRPYHTCIAVLLSGGRITKSDAERAFGATVKDQESTPQVDLPNAQYDAEYSALPTIGSARTPPTEPVGGFADEDFEGADAVAAPADAVADPAPSPAETPQGPSKEERVDPPAAESPNLDQKREPHLVETVRSAPTRAVPPDSSNAQRKVTTEKSHARARDLLDGQEQNGGKPISASQTRADGFSDASARANAPSRSPTASVPPGGGFDPVSLEMDEHGRGFLVGRTLFGFFDSLTEAEASSEAADVIEIVNRALARVAAVPVGAVTRDAEASGMTAVNDLLGPELAKRVGGVASYSTAAECRAAFVRVMLKSARVRSARQRDRAVAPVATAVARSVPDAAPVSSDAREAAYQAFCRENGIEPMSAAERAAAAAARRAAVVDAMPVWRDG